MSANSFYITTPIYYVNDSPHIGHAYTNIASDIIARYARLHNMNVKFLTGTDEHGQKIEKAANTLHVDTQDFVDKVSNRFRDLCATLNISNSDFIRTTETRHQNTVKDLWDKLYKNGDIYLDKYCGWYSIRDEAFYDSTEINEGVAYTGSPVEWIEEPSYFFKLSKYEKKLLSFYENAPNFVKPSSRYNEVISFVKRGLKDISISRVSSKWGITVPNNPEHVIYVWLDALTNYVSGLNTKIDNISDKQSNTNQDNLNDSFWPANLHVIGKDILKFHAIYWPAFLMSANIELPRCIFAHGWWTNEGQKISKSLGNTIDPIAIVNEFGIDQFRYFLIREMTFGQDGNFSKANLIQRINTELSNKLGNLVQRVVSFIHKNCEGAIPQFNTENDNYCYDIYDTSLLLEAQQTVGNVDTLMFNYDLTGALNQIMYLVEKSNVYIDQQAPWKLKKSDINLMNKVLCVMVEVIRYISILLIPFMPNASNKILDIIRVSKDNRNIGHLTRDHMLKFGHSINTPTIIFPTIQQLQSV